MDAITIRRSSSASCRSSAIRFSGMMSDSTSNSIHSIVSSSSCSTIPSFAMNSASLLARLASRKLAATLVPDRKICRPSVWPTGDFGSAVYKRMIRRANAFVRSRNPAMRIGSPPPLSAFRSPILDYASQPCASRTLIIASRIVFQVFCVSSTSFGNMQPSQQMWRMPRQLAPLSQ
jgi:hypothetical protein